MRAYTLQIPIAAVLILASCSAPRDVAVVDRLELRPCRSWSTHIAALCGTIFLPERRDSKGGRKVPIRVVELPARNPSTKNEPILFISGGPGLPATHSDGYVNWALDSVRATHDLLLIDVRGTGDDAPLSCNLYDDHKRLGAYVESMFPIARVRECAAQLSRRADLTQYTTEIAARDLDDARAALHVDQWSLFGGSYGTRLALEYMRRFPEHVRRVALIGVLPPEAPIGGDFVRGGQIALESAFAACAADPTCHSAAPDPRGDITMLLAQLGAKPAKAMLWNAETRAMEPMTLTRRAAQEALFVAAYEPSALQEMFPLVHNALYRDSMPALVQHFVNLQRARRGIRRDGVALSVYCAEDAPRLASATTAVESTLLGAPTLREALAACAVWPHGTMSSMFAQRVVASIPTLLISGGRDPVTPLYLADSAARGLSRSERYINPEAGHAFLDEEAQARLAAFFMQR